MYQAIAINKEYWVVLSNPCSKERAEVFRGSEMIGETFAVKTAEEVNNYKNVLR